MKKFTIDEENCGETFWHTVRMMRELCNELHRMEFFETIEISDELAELLPEIKGWNEGSENAPHPLLEVE